MTYDPEKTFNELVENAVDFLKRAVDEVKSFPKYSIINFYTSLELFLKARILKEHWSLVITRSKDPDIDKFLDGDFQSVTLDHSVMILDKTLKQPISKQAHAIFKELGNHRNRAVHFYHADLMNNPNDIIFIEIQSWIYLYQYLTEAWKIEFQKYKTAIDDLNERIKDLKKYYHAVYVTKEESIKRLESEKGHKIMICDVCGQHSMDLGRELYKPGNARCHVCNKNIDFMISIECPNCSGLVMFTWDGSAVCPSCGKQLGSEELIEILERDGDFIDDNIGLVANCNDCGSIESVRAINDGRYFCFDCFTYHDKVELCECCNTYNTGDMTMSYVMGCESCDGVGMD